MREMRNGGILVWAFLIGLVALDSAQGTEGDFERWRSYDQRTRNLVFRDSVEPDWFGDHSDRFWYRLRTGERSHQYIVVDAKAGERRLAFDHHRLGELLSEVTGDDVDSTQLQLKSLTFSSGLESCDFRYAGNAWTFVLPAGPLQAGDLSPVQSDAGLQAELRIVRSQGGGERVPIQFQNRLDTALRCYWVMSNGNLRLYGTIPPGQSKQLQTYVGHAWVLKDDSGAALAAFVASRFEERAIIDEATPRPKPFRRRGQRGRQQQSPSGKWRVEFIDDNVVLVEIATGERTVATGDGTSNNAYGGRVWWSPDSQHFVVMRTRRGLRRQIHIIDSAPDDSHHPRLLKFNYAKPGDRIDHPSVVLFSASRAWQPRVIDDALFANPYGIDDVAWHANGESFSFVYNQRGHQVLRLITVDADSAEPRITIDEVSDTFVCYSGKQFLHRIDTTNELIWMSERSGWNHLYLIDAATGQVKKAITSGQWVVRGVERVDQQQRRIYLQVSGIDPAESPYHVHLVRVDFDGTNFVRLTTGDGNHRWEFSPNDKYLIDTYSRVDLPPVTELRDAGDGQLICKLESADASRLLESGWQPPERFVAKGRDGETDIYGIVIRPTNFDANQRYPILEEIYAGPHSSFVPQNFGTHSRLYSMAELGFIVVKIDGMGTSHRSKAFHDVCWKNLADSGFPDRIAWLKAAAKERPEMDLSRVGIWGGSAGGQSAMRAVIAHGDFYRAAVADCGCHDNRVDKLWWNEQWMGWPIGSHYQQQSNVTQAHRMQGDLMLIWGELDRNVDPASTMQVIDALIRADKDFEQLIIPGAGHGAAGHPYAQRRLADFLIRKLK